MSHPAAFFVFYGDLADLARLSIGLPPTYIMLEGKTNSQLPIVSYRIHVQRLDLTAHLAHCWTMRLAEAFEPPTPADLAARKNCQFVMDYAADYLIAAGMILATNARIAIPNNVTLIEGQFRRLSWNKADLWHPTAQDNAPEADHASH